MPDWKILHAFAPYALTEPDRQLALGPPTGTLDDILGSKYSLLITFRRDNSPVFTPVLTAIAGGRIYVRSERASFKVKRLRRDPEALIGPCTGPGKPLGPPLRARGRVLELSEETAAERALSRRFGLDRALFEGISDLLRVDMCYLELTPEEEPR